MSILSSATDEDCASVTLDPLEHEWMLCASDGLWESLQPLLAVEPSLVNKKDFVTGFTCLHWAAKQGKVDLLSQLLAFAKENTIPVNVNVRSSAGYTPLHLAAMHGHTQVGCYNSGGDRVSCVTSASLKQQIITPLQLKSKEIFHQNIVKTVARTFNDLSWN